VVGGAAVRVVDVVVRGCRSEGEGRLK
jgi:hypothetical protein